MSVKIRSLTFSESFSQESESVGLLISSSVRLMSVESRRMFFRHLAFSRGTRNGREDAGTLEGTLRGLDLFNCLLTPPDKSGGRALRGRMRNTTDQEPRCTTQHQLTKNWPSKCPMHQVQSWLEDAQADHPPISWPPRWHSRREGRHPISTEIVRRSYTQLTQLLRLPCQRSFIARSGSDPLPKKLKTTTTARPARRRRKRRRSKTRRRQPLRLFSFTQPYIYIIYPTLSTVRYHRTTQSKADVNLIIIPSEA